MNGSRTKTHQSDTAKSTAAPKHSIRPKVNTPSSTHFIAPFDFSSEKAFSSPSAMIQLQRIAGNRAVKHLIQTKFKIGSPGDKYEKEADKVADQVSRMPMQPVQTKITDTDNTISRVQQSPCLQKLSPSVQLSTEQESIQENTESEIQARFISGISTSIQRKIAEDKELIQSKQQSLLTVLDEKEDIPEIQKKQQEDTDKKVSLLPAKSENNTPDIQEKPSDSSVISSSNTIVSKAIQSNNQGAPIDSSVQSHLEKAMSTNFSTVRVHTDSVSHKATKSINARAFTHKNHIWLGKGESQSDVNLMAHEATHVVQQDGVVRRKIQAQPPVQGENTNTQTPTETKPSTNPASPSSQSGQSQAQGTGTTQTSQPTPSSGSGKGSVSDAQPPQASESAHVSQESQSSTGSKESGKGEGQGTIADSGADVKLSVAEKKRIAQVQQQMSEASKQTQVLPTAEQTTSEARAAVEQPQEETTARSEKEVVTSLDNREPPSPEIEELCARIREVIKSRRPPDKNSLVKAEPKKMAEDAGGQLENSVQQDTARVEGEYSEINESPAESTPQKPAALESQPETVATSDPNASSALPDPLTEKDVSLDSEVESSQKKIEEAGMNSEPAQLVQSGPIAEARQQQEELTQMAQRDPAEVLAEAMAARQEAGQNMAQLQQQALQILASSRTGTVSQRSNTQQNMVESEEQMRVRVGKQASDIFTNAQNQVNTLLKPLQETAMQRWETGVQVLSTQFEQRLKIVKDWIDGRHSGLGGFFVGLWDAVAGLPDWVTQEYDAAEKDFSDGVCDLIRDISRDVNTVIASAEALIENARKQIAKLFDDLPANLQNWAASQKEQFNQQLNALHESAEQTRKDFNNNIIEKASQTVQDARQKIHELRSAAGGIVGQIISAVNEFLEDPVKFIIEGLLKLVGIDPAAFWALVAKIQSVMKDIADDPMKFANNLVDALSQGFKKFFDNFLKHMISGFFEWLFSGLGSVGVEIPKDFSLPSIITFCLQLMGITWPRIRQLLVKHVGEKNMALIEKAIELISTLIEKGPEGIFEMIKEQLNPQAILDQIIQTAVEFLIETLITKVSARIILMLNPAGAIVQAIEVIYRILKWIFDNAAKIFSLVETIVNGAADIIAGNTSGMANAVEKALARLICPVIDFLAGFLGLGDLPNKIAKAIGGFQDMVMKVLEKVIDWLAKKAKSLLKKLGIGGEDEEDKKKEDDEDVIVEEVPMGSVTHTLRIKPKSCEVTINPEEDSLDNVLKKGSNKLDDLSKTNEKAKDATEHINEMKETFKLVILLLQRIKNNKSKDKSDGQITIEDKDRECLKEFNRKLATLIIKYGVEFNVTDIADGLPDFGPVVVGRHKIPSKIDPDGTPRESHHVPPKQLALTFKAHWREIAKQIHNNNSNENKELEVIENNLTARCDKIQGENSEDSKAGDGLSAVSLNQATHKNKGGIAAHGTGLRNNIIRKISSILPLAMVNRGKDVAVNLRKTGYESYFKTLHSALGHNPDHLKIMKSTIENKKIQEDQKVVQISLGLKDMDDLANESFNLELQRSKAFVVQALENSMYDGPKKEWQDSLEGKGKGANAEGTAGMSLDALAKQTWKDQEILKD